MKNKPHILQAWAEKQQTATAAVNTQKTSLSYEDLVKLCNSIPEAPLANKQVFIPAIKVLRDGKLIKVPVNQDFERVLEECQKLGVDYVLSEHVPLTDNKGKDCVYVLNKPKVYEGFDVLEGD